MQEDIKRLREEIAQKDARIEKMEGWLAGQKENLDFTREQLRKRNDQLAVLQKRQGDNATRPDKPPIFFVVGRPRSGTNWLMRTLNAHPEILCRGEGRFFGRDVRYEHLKEMQTGEYIKQKIQPAPLYNAIAESEYLRLWVERSVWTRDDDPEEHLKSLTREAIYHYLGKALGNTNKRIVGDKTPLNSDYVLEEIGELTPEARVIHIIRDGRDVSISQLHHKWNRATDEGGVHEFTDEELSKRDRYRAGSWDESIFSERLLREHASGWARRVWQTREQGESLGENYAEIRYEGMLEDAERELQRLYSFLGTANDADIVSRCTDLTSFEKRSGGRERGQEDTRSGVRKGIAGDWKNVFTERDKEIFKEEAGEMLVELGYEEDMNW